MECVAMSQGKAVLFALAGAHGWLVELLFLGPAAWDLKMDCRVNPDAFGPRRALAAGGRRWEMAAPTNSQRGTGWALALPLMASRGGDP